MGFLKKAFSAVKKVVKNPVVKAIGSTVGKVINKVAKPVLKKIPIIGTVVSMADAAVKGVKNVVTSFIPKKDDTSVQNEVADNLEYAGTSVLSTYGVDGLNSQNTYSATPVNPQTGMNVTSAMDSTYSANPLDTQAAWDSGLTEKAVASAVQTATGSNPAKWDLSQLFSGILTAVKSNSSVDAFLNKVDNTAAAKLAPAVEGAAIGGITSALKKYWWVLLAIPAAFFMMSKLFSKK